MENICFKTITTGFRKPTNEILAVVTNTVPGSPGFRCVRECVQAMRPDWDKKSDSLRNHYVRNHAYTNEMPPINLLWTYIPLLHCRIVFWLF